MDLPKRKANRLTEYDYSSNGAYFVTVCTQDRKEIFWNVGADIIRPDKLSKYGTIAEKAIIDIEKHYTGITVDKYVVMPNHVHLILSVKNEGGRMISAPTISTVIGQMKRIVSKQIGFPVWQKSFHDHVIRNEQDYKEIREYIDTNPIKWEEDCFYAKKEM